MNSYMTIMVRVVSARAQAAMSQIAGKTAALEASSRAAGAAAAGIGGARALSSLTKWGSQLQWAGRQIQYSFTLPLLLAGGAALKFQLDNEKAFTHVKKVYGDTAAAAAYFRKQNSGLSQEMANTKATQTAANELDALGRAFEALSNKYGVAQKDVLEVAGAWAAAGASGAALAKSVDLTMQAVILGDMNAAKATESLISIQAQYGLNTKELTLTLAELNQIENQTGISMAGLIDGFARAAGVARNAGIDVRHLGALLAALVPSAGSAAAAGNALKTIISRLLSPTKEASDVMGAMGINIKGMAWQGANAIDRLQIMSDHFNKLGGSAKAVVSSLVASRYQINKFSVLMEELGPKFSYYEKALQATSSRGKVFTQMQKELNTVLESNPQRLKQIWVILQNAMANVIQPMIPYIISLFNTIKNLVQGFSNLNPNVQKFILMGLGAIAIFGILVRMTGATAVLLSELGKALFFLARMMGLFAVATSVVDGSLIVTQGYLVRFLNTLLVAPVKFFVTALGAYFMSLMTVVAGALTTATLAVAAWGSSILPMVSGIIAAFFGILEAGLLGNTIRAIFAALSAYIATAFAAVSAGIAGALAPALAALGAFFLNARVIQYVWVVSSLASLKLWVLGVMTRVSLLGAWMQEAMLGIWTLLTVPGYLFGIVIRTWTALTVAIATRWTLLQGWIAGITAAGSGSITAIWIAFNTRLLGIWIAFNSGIRLVWLKTMAFLANPAIIYRALASIGAAIASGVGAIVGAISLPVILAVTTAVAVVIGILYAFRTQLTQIWNNAVQYMSNSSSGLGKVFSSMAKGIINVFNMLPQGVQNAMIAVVNVVRAAALAVYSWFSYLNPFAHHSPSLVENVTKGVSEIVKQYSNLSQLKHYVDAAYAEIKRFSDLTAKFGISASAAQHAQDRATLKNAGAGQALASYNRLIAILGKLTPMLERLKTAIAAQQGVVDAWQAKLDKANAKLDAQQAILDRLKDKLSGYQDKLSAAQDALSTLSNTPLKGMQAMEDKIFANEQAQKKLRLEMMKMEDVYGTLDQVKSKIEGINGAQELLRGQQAGLRAAGAGSEVLKGYDDQISKLDEQKKKYQETADKLEEMQAKLDKLQRAAEKLDLIKAMKFDKLQHEIEKAANNVKEMSFKDIIKGIKQAQKDIKKYGDKVNDATKEVDAQQAIVDKLVKNRDRLQAILDKENKKLDKLQAKYNKVNDAIQAINSAIQDVMSNADKMAAKLSKAGDAAAGGLSPGMQNFENAGNASFPDVGGTGIPLRKDWQDQSKQIEDITSQLAADTAKMFDDLNPFKSMKGKAAEVWGWIKNKMTNMAQGTSDAISKIFGGVDNPFHGFEVDLSGIGSFLTGVLKSVSDFVGAAWRLLGPSFMKIFNAVKDGFKAFWDEVGPQLEQFAPLIKPIGKAIKNLWTVAKPVLAILGGAFLLIAKIILEMLANVIKPVFKAIGGIIAGVIQVIRGIIEVVVGLLTGDWKMAWDGFVDILAGVWKVIWKLIGGLVETIEGLVKGFVEGVIGFFKWLWDELVGHSIVPDMIDGIIYWFEKLVGLVKWLWKDVLLPIFKLFKKVWNDYVKPAIKLWWTGIKAEWSVLKALGKWVWDNVLKPVWKRIKDLWDAVEDSIKKWWGAITNIWNKLRALGGWVWDNILRPIRDRFEDAFNRVRDIVENAKKAITDKFDTLKDKANDLVDVVRGIPGKLKDLARDFGSAGKTLIDAFIDGLKKAKDVTLDIAGDIWGAVKKSLNAAIDSINDAIPNSIGKGPLTVNLPDNPFPHFLAKGGVARARTGGILARIAEGGHDEAVVPLSGPYMPKGLFGGGGTSTVNNHFHGDLVFPNITDPNDADEFIENLTRLAS